MAKLAYMSFAVFCRLSPFVTIIFGVMGWTIWLLKEEGARDVQAERAQQTTCPDY